MSACRALIVIDMQRGFLEAGYPLFCGEQAREIIPAVKRLIEEEIQEGTALFFTADTHAPDDEEFESYPPHCIRGSVEAQLIPELAGYREHATLIEKRRFSAFFNTDLDQRLRTLKARRLIVCGVCTDICVLHTVADARFRDYDVEVYKDCVTSFDRKAHAFALTHMEKVLGAQITQEKAQ